MIALLMKVEAISAGHYHASHFGDFDKLQILTIEGLLNGTEYPQYPNASAATSASRRHG